jgi:cation:H+ antiporter
LGLALAGITAGELFTLWGVGFWSVLLAVVYCLSLFLIKQYEPHERWAPRQEPEDSEFKEQSRQNEAAAEQAKEKEKKYAQWSLTRLLIFFALGAVVILVTGVVLAFVGDALAQQTGLGANMVGVALLGIATALPEINATRMTVRLGNYDMAISDVLGSNFFVVGLLFLADLAYRPGPILETAGGTVIFSICACVIMTAIYLAGLIELRNRTLFGMGLDSALVLVVYLGSIAVLFAMR